MLRWCKFGHTPLTQALLVSVLLHGAALAAIVGSALWYIAPALIIQADGQPGAPQGGLGFHSSPGPERPSISPLISVSPHTAQMASEVFVDKLATEVSVESLQPLLGAEAEPLAALPHPEALPRPSAALKRAQPTVRGAATGLVQRVSLRTQPQMAGLIAAAMPGGVGKQGKGSGSGFEVGNGEGTGGQGGSGANFAGNRPPRYPDIAQINGWEGKVLLRLYVSAQGEVTRVDLARTSGYPVLDAAAVSAARSWRGQPARRGGVPVASEEVQEVWFHLK